MSRDGDVAQVARRFSSILSEQLPRIWDGKDAILEMKRRNDQWRQLEWIGWFGEMIAKDALRGQCEMPGKQYGKVVFDVFQSINWDIKVHPNSQSAAILNDREAIDQSISAFGHHGLIMLCVDCEYDTDGSFKAWHDQLKGGKSRYEEERIARGARSRRRKTKATLTDVAVIVLNSDCCCRLGSKQKNWRNADGSPRREKYSIDQLLVETLTIK